MEFQLRTCTEAQLPEILEIFNDAILNSTALYDYKIRTMNMMYAWYNDKIKGNYPIVGAFDSGGSLLGFASYGPFRVRPAYKYTMEHSVYIRKDMRGHGLGETLLKEIIKKAEEQNYHQLIAAIDGSNEISIQLHKKIGFEYCGCVKQAGYKFGKWLDLVLYQLILPTPEKPVED